MFCDADVAYIFHASYIIFYRGMTSDCVCVYVGTWGWGIIMLRIGAVWQQYVHSGVDWDQRLVGA